ncbi:MAG TPA: hypothetical protein VH480_16065 [Streptosporangiaceae bacterium]
MREDISISYRGAGYEIGRGKHFYGIWTAGATQSQPMEWWPDTPEGWSGAWARFISIEAPGTIVPVSPPAPPPAGPARPLEAARTALAGARPPAVLAAGLIALGVVLGIAGLFPSYVGGASLASTAELLVPHLIYFAVWAGSAVLILRGGDRLRAGALLGTGLSAVTFGFYLADLGQVISGGAHLMGAGLLLGLLGWAACAAGSVIALRLKPAAPPAMPQRHEIAPVVMLLLAGLGVAAAFVPSWDSFTLQTSTGATQTVTAGYAFANPAAVIAGNVAVMVGLIVVVAAAAVWRPVRFGAALLAGAIAAMAAQALSAVIQVAQGVSPAEFGFSPAQATQAGLTISSGLTPAFWIYCVFLVALIASAAWMLLTPVPAAPARPPAADPPAHDAPHATLAVGAPQAAVTRPLAPGTPPAAAETQPQSAEAPNSPQR